MYQGAIPKRGEMALEPLCSTSTYLAKSANADCKSAPLEKLTRH